MKVRVLFLFNTASTSADVSYQLNSNVDLTGSASASIVFSHIAAMEGPTTSYDYGIVGILQMVVLHGI